jgi:hypothetical protein
MSGGATGWLRVGRPKRNGHSATTDKPPSSRLVHIADTPADVTPVCWVEPHDANTPAM